MPTDLVSDVAANPIWYHTLELSPVVVTPGWFDLRPVLEKLPWPEVSGMRCLDVATYDGCLAFELERRGATDVMATDIANHEDWDWLPRDRARGLDYLRAVAGQKGRGFEIASAALGSKVHREWVSVYDLSPEVHGTFDVVVCGCLLLHLRDPFRALEAIRSVCRGTFLSIEQIDFDLSILRRHRPTFDLVGDRGQWFVPNVAGHRSMIDAAGFDILASPRPFAEPLGVGHPRVRTTVRTRFQRWALGAEGIPISAVLSRPSD